MSKNAMITRPAVVSALILSLASASGIASAGTVIANSGLSIEAGDVRQIYGGEMQAKNGVHLIPVENLAEQPNFLDKVIKMDSTKYQNHWTKKSFREGLNPPSVDNTDAEVINFVKSTPGGVGYISGPAPAGVKSVMTY